MWKRRKRANCFLVNFFVGSDGVVSVDVDADDADAGADVDVDVTDSLLFSSELFVNTSFALIFASSNINCFFFSLFLLAFEIV